MKKTLLLTGVLLALCASLASAAGLSLGWAVSTAENTCPSSATSALDKANLCTSNSGASVMIGSIVSPGVNNVVGELIVLDMQESTTPLGAPLSPWWNFDALTGCRGNIAPANTPGASISPSFDPLNDEGICQNLWQTTASSASSYQANTPSNSRARLSMAAAVAAGQDWLAGDEWYSFRFVLDNRRTVNAGSCAGCLDGACFSFTLAQINSGNPGEDKSVDTPAGKNGQSVSYR